MLKSTIKTFALFSFIILIGCNDDGFERDGASTVSFSGQTTRILMAEELASALTNFDKSATDLMEMFANQTADGNDANPFNSQELNDATKSIRSKVAASKDFFSANTVDAATVKETFDTWMNAQTDLFDEFQVRHIGSICE